MKTNKYLYIVSLMLVLASCGKKPASVERPSFSCDSAYAYIDYQMSLGPRVPNGKGHSDCATWLVAFLRESGADVTIQRGEMPDYSGRQQQVLNIVGHFGGYDRDAILLCAHYDTRPWTDEEEEYADRKYNVPGANDGASGVGVLLEVARQLSLLDSISQPVDIVFFDCEDMGTPTFFTGAQRDNTWCLGSQLWAERRLRDILAGDNVQRYSFGILLDMVGAPDAVFSREMISEQFASNYVEQIWRKAQELGHGRYFVQSASYPITDDHVYVNRAGVPCVDIIHYDAKNASGFPEWWHTRKDNMENISLATLQAVGETVMGMICE